MCDDIDITLARQFQQDEQARKNGQPWTDPSLGEAPRPLPFPCDVFPASLRPYCLEVAATKCAPVDYVGSAMLSSASAAIGRSLCLRLKDDWREFCPLFMELVGPPGFVKSPIFKDVNGPIDEHEEKYRKEWLDACEMLRNSASQDPFSEREPLPVRKRLVVRDTTREVLALILEENPRGVVQLFDEGAALMKSMNEYKANGGSDREFYLSLWSCSTYTMDRKGKGKGATESVYLHRPFVTILACTTPSSLDLLVDEKRRADGFLDRFMFAIPESCPEQRWIDEPVSTASRKAWGDAIGALLGREMEVKDGTPVSKDVPLSASAKARWTAWYDEQSKKVHQFEFTRYSGMLSKSRQICARLALILAALRWAAGQSTSDGPIYVEPEDVEGAIRLIDYFVSTFKRVDHIIHKGSGDPTTQRILSWLRRHQLRTFSEAKILDDLRDLKTNLGALRSALSVLVSADVIRAKIIEGVKGKRGRKPSPSYDVNPAILKVPDKTENTYIN